MTTKSLLLTVASFLLLVSNEARAAHTYLPLRCENDAVFVHNGVTGQTVEANFGTNLMGLTFTNSVTFDFYSPPFATNLDVTTDERATGQVSLTNTDTTGVYSFSATTRMQYFDYDPATGTNVLVVDTDATAALSVTNGALVNFSLPKQNPPSDYSFSQGHLLHIAVIIGVTSGNPGGYGQLLYNGSTNTTSYGDFPQGMPVSLVWPITSVTTTLMPPTILSFKVQGDPVAQVNCSGTPGGTYLIQATTNLCNAASWATIGTNVAGTNGLFTFTDSDTNNYRCRFYRASTP